MKITPEDGPIICLPLKMEDFLLSGTGFGPPLDELGHPNQNFGHSNSTAWVA
ncbi:MAG: hypothetical protein IPH42_11020 [Bacteroidetes bacterium]|nr:hypothetical protein [Bacteroidota bacterium]